MNRRLARIGNRVGVWLYRALNGQLASARRDVRVLLLTTRGRRTGLPRSTCVRYLDVVGRLVVWGTGAGSPRDPDWFMNLRAADTTDVQIGASTSRCGRGSLSGTSGTRCGRARSWSMLPRS